MLSQNTKQEIGDKRQPSKQTIPVVMETPASSNIEITRNNTPQSARITTATPPPSSPTELESSNSVAADFEKSQVDPGEAPLTSQQTATGPATTNPSYNIQAQSGSSSQKPGPKEVLRGKCLWFDQKKGFGFITPDDEGDNVFVHHTEILARGFRSLELGEPVEFSLETDERGRIKAINVTGPHGAYVRGGQSISGAPNANLGRKMFFQSPHWTSSPQQTMADPQAVQQQTQQSVNAIGIQWPTQSSPVVPIVLYPHPSSQMMDSSMTQYPVFVGAPHGFHQYVPVHMTHAASSPPVPYNYYMVQDEPAMAQMRLRASYNNYPPNHSAGAHQQQQIDDPQTNSATAHLASLNLGRNDPMNHHQQSPRPFRLPPSQKPIQTHTAS
eukprot:c12011_g1_i2.p1 GENE.c12011_g1_i2~~c12011_g1_i2.p1  ORF type:complete len:384 (+),score=73.64 c12011_g1_i2:193-1344(+)